MRQHYDNNALKLPVLNASQSGDCTVPFGSLLINLIIGTKQEDKNNSCI